MFLIVLGILSLVLALSRPLYPWVHEPCTVAVLLAIATILPALLGVIVTTIAVRMLDQRPDEPSRGQYFFHRGQGALQFLLGGMHAAILLATDWLILCGGVPGVGQWPAVPGLIATLPFLASVTLLWITLYPADRAVRQIAVEVYLYRARPVEPVWRLGEYLAYHLRHQVLFVFLPMLLILALRDIIEHYERPLVELAQDGSVPDLLLGAAAGLVAIFAPVLLRYIWITQRLPEGPLRDKLVMLAMRLGVGFREILVWKSGGMIVNAAVMGVVAPLRYVLLTDGMLSQMDDTKIEAVFAHEAGHVKRHHILFFLLFSLISGCILTIFSIYTRAIEPLHYQIAAAVLGLVLAVKWGLLFFSVSRKFERQADLYGVRALESAGVPCSQPCLLHNRLEQGPPAPPAGAVCTTCAHLFSDTLHDVAVLNGIAPEAGSLRHGSIAGRSRFLLGLASDPRSTLEFERAVARTKWGIFVVACGMSLWAAYALRLWNLGLRLIS